MIKGFKEFILRDNMITLAVGVAVGAAFSKIVEAIVKDLITPLIGAVVKSPDFSSIFFTINDSKFMVGDFINSLMSFFIIVFSVYFFVLTPINILIARAKRDLKKLEPKKKECPECLSEIPKEATRCAFCTSKLS
ncbi:MAG: large conductance mechanosensitive channel protein MscL [bacterium]